jgi:uncharacterized protein YjiS (DUF1127 family)
MNDTNLPLTISKPAPNLPVQQLGRTVYVLIKNAAGCVREWNERSRQRHRLLELDDRLLRDIGLTRADVKREIDKPFWLA